jgi:hypothetical protein
MRITATFATPQITTKYAASATVYLACDVSVVPGLGMTFFCGFLLHKSITGIDKKHGNYVQY